MLDPDMLAGFKLLADIKEEGGLEAVLSPGIPSITTFATDPMMTCQKCGNLELSDPDNFS